MTLPAGGNLPPISLADLNAEFGYGTNLNAYRGKLVGLPSSACKVVSSGVVALSDFYSTNKVVAGGPVGRDGYFTVPQYKTITMVVQGGQAGFAGSAGVYVGGPAAGSATPPDNGQAGGPSGIGSYATAVGGAPNGGAGGYFAVTYTNPLLGGTGPASGSALLATVGGGGAGGAGGPIYGWNGFGYVFSGNAASGAGGAAGYAQTSWTGEP
jgi:hypothetical protein